MGIRRQRAEELARLERKTLEDRFRSLIREGLGCSPFEAEAVLEAVKEVFGPHLGDPPAQAMPGRMTLTAVDAEEPAGKPIAACQKRTVTLTVHRGAEDDRLFQELGPAAWRQARIPDLCQEALSQGGLLTREDLAYRVFFVGTRTVSRDLSALRRAQPAVPVPLRSTVHDLGPVLTHRVEIVRWALSGKTTTEICRGLYHSPAAVANYLGTFARCAQLSHRGLHPNQIAFLLHRGEGLVLRYLSLLEEVKDDPNRAYHLDELLGLGRAGEKKRSAGGGAAHGN